MPHAAALPPAVSASPYRTAGVVTDDGHALPLVGAALTARAGGGVARLELVQRFANPGTAPVHVRYRMPLPADAAVSGYAFTLGGRTIRGRVDRTHAARAAFEQAIVEGRTAALLEQDRADVFTQRLGNLPPGAELCARIELDLRLRWLPEGEWELRFPLVLGPRYVGPGDRAADAAATAIAVAPDGVAARLTLALTITDALTPGGAPASPSHALAAAARDGDRDDGAYRLRALDGAALDRDLVVRWPVARPEVGLQLAVARPAAPLAGAEHPDAAYGLITIAPPAPAHRGRTVPRDLIVLLDTSGSMAGAPLALARRMLHLVIESLSDDDRLELIEFSSSPRRYQRGPVAATADARRAAQRWLAGRQAGGSTEMHTAIVEAIGRVRAPEPVGTGLMLAVAVGGLVINVLCAWILHPLHAHSLNARGAYLHVLGDLLGSIGTVAAGLIIRWTGWELADPIASIVVGIGVGELTSRIVGLDRRASLSSSSRITGAEKPRSRDGTGSAASPVKRQVWLSLRRWSRRVVSPARVSPSRRRGRSRPSGPISPSATGMCSGSLSAWPGVGGVCWDSVRV